MNKPHSSAPTFPRGNILQLVIVQMVTEGLSTLSDSHCETINGTRNSSFVTVVDLLCKSSQHTPSSQTVTLRCRICLDSSDSRELITPCYCTGTIGLLHKDCLEKWLNTSKTNICEICNYEFKVEYAYPSLFEWITYGGKGESRARRRHLWTDCVCFIIMVPLMTLCAWLTAVSGTDSGVTVAVSWQSICLGSLFAVLFVVFLIWMVFSVRYHQQSWLQWRHDNQHITLLECPSRMDPNKEVERITYSPLVPSSRTVTTGSLQLPIRSTPSMVAGDSRIVSDLLDATSKSHSFRSLRLGQQPDMFVMASDSASSFETISHPVLIHREQISPVASRSTTEIATTVSTNKHLEPNPRILDNRTTNIHAIITPTYTSDERTPTPDAISAR